MNDRHKVLAKLVDGQVVQIGPTTSWDRAQAIWQQCLGKWPEVRMPKGWAKVQYFMVRATDDPKYLHAPPVHNTRVRTLREGSSEKGYKNDIYALKTVGKPLGLRGTPGGWVMQEGKRGWLGQGWYVAVARVDPTVALVYRDGRHFVYRQFNPHLV